jgi:hypothetical protein
MLRIIIEIDDKELARKITTEIDNSGMPKIITEEGEFTPKNVPPPPQELLNLAKSLGAVNAGPAPSWISQSQSTEPSISKTEFNDQQILDAGPMTDNLSNQKDIENSSEQKTSDEPVTEALDAGNFKVQTTGDY